MSQYEHRCAAVTSTDQNTGDPLLGKGEGLTEGTHDVENIVAPLAREPLGSCAGDGDRNVQGPSVDAPRSHLVNRECPSQHHARLFTAHSDGDEVTWLSALSYPRGSEGKNVVVPDSTVVQHFGFDLLDHQISPCFCNCSRDCSRK